MKRIARVTAITAFFAICALSAALAQQQIAGTWQIEPSHRPGYVQLSLQYGHDRSEQRSDDYSSDALPQTLGLSAAQIQGPTSPATFSIARDAGTIAFTGAVGGGSGAGRFVFTPSASYPAELAKRGIAAPDAEKLLGATLLDLSTQYIDAMAAAGYPSTDFDRLIAFRALGITPESARALRASFGPVDAEHLISLTALHVTPAYARDLRSVGITGLDAEGLVEMKALGVDSAYVKELAGAGYPHLSAEQITQMRALHIDPAYIKRMQAHGLKDLTVEKLVQLKAMGF